MFGVQFYPTPAEVVDKMLEPFKIELRWASERGLVHLGPRKFLEPSAGKGDILDRLVERYGVDRKNIVCCEMDQDLRAVLAGKGYTVVDSDFLAFNDDSIIFDTVVMNPPFANADDHLMKAWEVLSHGDIACLYPTEMLSNPIYEGRRRAKSLIEQFGRSENIGHVFSDAERKTDVEVSIVWLHKEKEPTIVEFDFVPDTDSFPDMDEIEQNEVAKRDMIVALVHQYEAAKASLERMVEEERKYRFYTTGIKVPSIMDSRSELLGALKKAF